jgi:Flp pilus assembly pilin Flp
VEKAMFQKFLRDDTGLELSEYAVAAALIAIAVAGVFTALGDSISLKIGELGSHIASGK